MPQTIKIMNWNIEQLGETRSSEDDRIKRIAQLINDHDPDIISIIELKTTNDSTAIKIADKIHNEVGKNTYKYILSYQNLLESHCFFYKPSSVIPICIKSGITGVLDSTALLKENFVEADGKSTTKDNNNNWLENYFPLVEYPNRDLKNMRPPCAGFFKTKNTNAYFSLLAWHNAAGSLKGNNDKKPVTEMESLATVDYITKKEFEITISNNKTKIDKIIISGDFNVDYLSNNRSLIYQKYTGYTTVLTQVAQKTHLHKYDPKNDSSYTNYDALKSSLFDNFILTNITYGNQSVVDIPLYIKNKGDNFIKQLFKDSGINQQKIIKERVKKSSKSNVEKLLNTNRVEKDKKSKVMKKHSKMSFKFGKVSTISMTAIKEVLKDDELADEIIISINGTSVKQYQIQQKAKKYIKKPNLIIHNDLLMLAQLLYSDHLPTIVDITL